MSIFSGVSNPGIEISQFTTSEHAVLLQIAELVDPNADRILFWDDSASSYAYLTVGAGLQIVGTTLSSSSASVAWGAITGTLSSQTDLQSALDAKAAASHTHTASAITDFDTQVRTSRLDQMAAPTASVSLNSQKITNLLDPVADQDAATKAYADTVAQGLSVKSSVLLATAAALPTNTYNNGASGVGATLTAVATGVLTIDGTAVALNDRILVKDESTTANNGIYLCTVAGAVDVAYVLTRTSDFNQSAEIPGGFTFVESGTTNADSGWVCTTNPTVTVGTTAITFVQFSGAGQITAGGGLTKTGNTIDAVGTTGRITVQADSIDISTSYVGQSSITTVGTITSGGLGTGAVIGGATVTLGSDASYDVYYRGATGILTRLGMGTTGQFLSANTGAAPSWATPAGSGTVNAGTAGQMAYYATSTTAVSGNANVTISGSALTIGVAGSGAGTLLLSGLTSGTTTLAVSAATSGTLTLPAATDTLVGKATTDTFTNKTLDTAGVGNVLRINGTQVTAVTGSGSVVLATSPTLTTPVLGTPTSGTLTNCTGLPVAGITASTTTALGVGSIELGHATDTTIARVSAGVISVEGVTVDTISAANTLTNKTIALGSNTVSGTIAQFNTAVTDADFATLAGTETLSGKTLTAPKIANAGFIADANGNEQIIFTTTASAVNEITITNAATTTAPIIAATGGDTNIDLKLTAKGTGAINATTKVKFDKLAYFVEFDNGNSSTADTIDWTVGNNQKSTLTGNCTYTFTAPTGPCHLTLKLIQDATGSRTVTWPATVHWSGGTAPTLTTTASKVDIVTMYFDGTTYFANYSLNFTA